MLKSYLKKIVRIANQGDAREENYYAAFEELLGKLAQSFGKGKIHIATLPKSTEAGNPDFRVWDGRQHVVGYFEGLEEDVWEHRIGGYQVCDKWLKDRKGRILSLDDVKHYCKLTTAIEHTINIQQSIDEIYNEAEKKLIDF